MNQMISGFEPYWKKVGNNYQTEKITYYASGYEETRKADGSVQKRYYLNTPTGLAAIYTEDENGNGALHYIHQDYQGSIVAISDESGLLEQSLSYDAWGQRRNPTNWGNYDLTEEPLFERGYTGHEHLDEFGLINMNGRMYDPVLGQMLSPDNFVQNATNGQNYNRYAYVLNNPLKYTDPDGEWVHLVVGAVIGGITGTIVGLNNGAKGWKLAGYIAVGAAAGALSAGVGSGVNAAIAGGGFGAGFAGTATVSSTGFIAGAATGASAGVTNGLITGTVYGTLGGQNFGDAFVQGGLNQAWKQGLSGAAVGGVLGGIDAARQDRNFWTGGYKTYKTSDAPLFANSDESSISFNEDGFTVKNSSGETIYYKPETDDLVRGIHGDGAYPIKNNHGIKHAVDGVTSPGKTGQVFKITDPFNDSFINVGSNSVTIDKSFVIGENTINSTLGGGWLSAPPNTGWNAIFKLVGYKF